MLYNNVSSATMRTTHAISCATLQRTHQYATSACNKCKTGTLEFFFDRAVNAHYASCLNCGAESYSLPALPF